MAHSTSIAFVGDKLVVGALDTSFLTATSRIFPGTAVLNGPVYIGLVPKVVAPTASCMIGPSLPGTSFPASLEVTGITNILGTFNVVGVSLFTGPVTITGVSILNGAKIANSIDITNGLDIDNSVSISNLTSFCHGVLTCETLVCGPIASLWLEGRFASKKNFDIEHPTKSGWRLRHTCPEAPYNDVYVRGKVMNTNIIKLPDYWTNFVDLSTITVLFAPIGKHQNIFIEKIENNEIVLSEEYGKSIHCFYQVYGERLDGSKLIPEYEGTTPEDYPGSNEEYSIVGWNYDRRVK